jgi:hypothetical protein
VLSALRRRLTAGRFWPTVSLILLPAVLSLALYGPVLNLPYFWDDYPHFNFATTRSLWQVWTNATGLPYYRPLTVTIYQFFFERLPFGATLLPHLTEVLGHVLACILEGSAAGLLFEGPSRTGTDSQPWARATVAVTAAVFFATYPFAELTVSCFSYATHVWLVDLSLAGQVAVLAAARGRGSLFALLAIAAALLAPMTNEAGVMAGPMLGVALWVYDPAHARRRPWLPAGLVLASAAFEFPGPVRQLGVFARRSFHGGWRRAQPDTGLAVPGP